MIILPPKDEDKTVIQLKKIMVSVPLPLINNKTQNQRPQKSKSPKNQIIKNVQGQVKTIFLNIKSKKKKIRRED